MPFSFAMRVTVEAAGMARSVLASRRRVGWLRFLAGFEALQRQPEPIRDPRQGPVVAEQASGRPIVGGGRVVGLDPRRLTAPWGPPRWCPQPLLGAQSADPGVDGVVIGRGRVL